MDILTILLIKTRKGDNFTYKDTKKKNRFGNIIKISVLHIYQDGYYGKKHLSKKLLRMLNKKETLKFK